MDDIMPDLDVADPQHRVDPAVLGAARLELEAGPGRVALARDEDVGAVVRLDDDLGVGLERLSVVGRHVAPVAACVEDFAFFAWERLEGLV